WAVATAPEDMQAYATVYADLLTSQIVERQYVEIAEKLGGVNVVDRIPFNPTGETSWAPIVLRLKSSGVKAMSFVGVPEVLAQLLKAMDEVGYRPNLIMNDAGFYAEILLTRAGTSAEGVVVRTAFSLFEEADRVPAVRDYLDMMATYNPSGKVAGLGMQSTSAFLLFARAARDCIAANGGVLTRVCVMSTASTVTDWTGGGLHAPSSPGTNDPSPCYQIIHVVDGAFTRLYPPLEPTDADLALVPTAELTDTGWACDPSTVVQLEGDYGDASLGKLPQ
ncbi:MAG: ABC transporter substrate-binding protein, partial [Actinomycetota bacterium]